MRTARRAVPRRAIVALALTGCIAAGVAAQATSSLPPAPYVPSIGTEPQGWLLAPPSKLLINPSLVPDVKKAPFHANQQWRAVLLNANRYALNTWWDQHMATKDTYTKPETILTGEEVRAFTSEAYGLAVSLATGAYDPNSVGFDRQTAIERTVMLVGLVARNHRVNTTNGGGWGGEWQGSYWASMIAQAGWLLATDLPATDGLLIGRMLESEANSVTARHIHYYRDRAGNILTPKDTGAEELAWDGMALFTAVELLPFNPKRGYWAEQAYVRMLASYARPSDVTSQAVVSGLEPDVFLQGSNAEPSGLVVNHGRLNPDYTACVGLNLAAASLAPLIGDGVPDAARFNAGSTYSALVHWHFSNGQTVYQPNSGVINYPQGSSWGSQRQIMFAVLDAQMRSLGFGKKSNAADFEQRHLTEVVKMQARSGTGQTYQVGDLDRYPLREEMVSANAGLAYLTDWVASKGIVHWDPSGASAKATQRVHL